MPALIEWATVQGLRMPSIIYGTAWKEARTEALVAQAVAAGFRGIDTACQPKHYAEDAVGAGVARALTAGLSRAELYLQSKFTPLASHDPLRVPYDRNAPLAAQIAQSCAVSLAQLRTDYLDCLILHSPLATFGATLAAWRALEARVAAGAVRILGLSNCYVAADFAALYQAATIKPAVLQNRFHARTGYDRELRAFCRAHGVVYQSFWTLTANPDVLASATVTRLATAFACTPAQILLRYLTQIGVVPLTGTTSAQHMADDLAMFRIALDRAQCAAMARLF